jgi:magnesium transporter
MIKAYDAAASRMIAFDPDAQSSVPDTWRWIDVQSPTAAQERRLETLLGVDLPTAEEMKDIEPSSRLYRENGAVFMTANVVWRSDSDEPDSAPITFILEHSRLITIRHSTPRSFAAFAAYAEKHGEVCGSGAHLMMGLLESIIDRTAEVLERSGAEVDALSRTVFRMKGGPGQRASTSASLRELLARLALNQNLTTKVRDSLVSLGRMISFCSAVFDPKGDTELREHVRSVSRDIQSLTDHASYITQTTSFLQDAALGLINLEQNEIIKIFSVAAVMFLPPTMVASIYGMNFAVMPELKWTMGYPFAIVLMALSALVPYLYFRRRGWL